MKALVTGGTGFIGSQVVRALLAAGHDVRVVARDGASRTRLADVEKKIEWVSADLFAGHDDDAAVAKATELAHGVDVCVHSAWYAVPGKYLEASENLACVRGSLALLRGLVLARVPRAILTGTCFEYDFDFGWLSEDTPTRPASLYAAAKCATRLLAEPLAKAGGIELAWVRPFYQYGPHEDARRLVPYVIDTLLAGKEAGVTRGLQVRDFLHVADVGAAIAAVATTKGLTGAVNIGSGRPVTVREIVATIADVLGCTDRVKFGARPDNPTDPPFICADTRRLVEATGFAPRFDLASGLADTIAWRRAHP